MWSDSLLCWAQLISAINWNQNKQKRRKNKRSSAAVSSVRLSVFALSLFPIAVWQGSRWRGSWWAGEIGAIYVVCIFESPRWRCHASRRLIVPFYLIKDNNGCPRGGAVYDAKTWAGYFITRVADCRLAPTHFACIISTDWQVLIDERLFSRAHSS